ncbi:MAG: dihydroorotase [Gemmatimonadota bacterium]|nr:MAG: dihydroorotase [Gemmatimonadota bacterium]
MKPMLIRGGRVVDPSQDHDGVADLLIVDGKIEAQGKKLSAPDGAETIDAKGKVVAPGLVDIHVHLREPGREDAETVASGAMAAAAGGFTSVCAMPNTDPVTDNQAAVGFIVKQGAAAGGARVYPIGATSLGQAGKQLSEFGEMVAAGAVAVSDDGHPIVSSQLMRTALEYARSFGIPVAEHCEDPYLFQGGAMHEGTVSTQLGLKGIPAAAEEIMVARNILLAGLTGGHVHLCHMSTRESVNLIRRGKERGVNVTAEAAPHHFVLTHEACRGYDTNAKMNPPLREPEDVEAVRAGLADGTLDAIATDHAPHHYELKEREFDDAPFGVIGLETALGLGLTQLVDTGVLTLAQLIRCMSSEPARIFHLPAGTLRKGSSADVVVFDPDARWVVDPARFLSKSRNTPFTGWELRGRVERTIVGGVTVFSGAKG